MLLLLFWGTLHHKIEHYMVEYERILFLDADTLVRRNIDHLFSSKMHSDVSAVAACTNSSFNGGVVLLRPSMTIARRLFTTHTGIKRCEMKVTDQSLMNKAFPNWQRMPQTYNVAHHASHFRKVTELDAHIVHVVGEPKINWCRHRRLEREAPSLRIKK